MAQISFHSEDIEFTLNKKTLIREWISDTIKREKQKAGDISYVFCSDDYLLKLNKDYLDHDTLTDIITFDYSEGEGEKGEGDRGQGKGGRGNPKPETRIVSGDIFISLDRIKENAGKFSVSLEDELHRVMIHGVLHLCGYKDKSKADKAEMTAREDFYLNLLGKLGAGKKVK